MKFFNFVWLISPQVDVVTTSVKQLLYSLTSSSKSAALEGMFTNNISVRGQLRGLLTSSRQHALAQRCSSARMRAGTFRSTLCLTKLGFGVLFIRHHAVKLQYILPFNMDPHICSQNDIYDNVSLQYADNCHSSKSNNQLLDPSRNPTRSSWRAVPHIHVMWNDGSCGLVLSYTFGISTLAKSTGPS